MSLQPILKMPFCKKYAALEAEQAPPSGAKMI